MPSASSLHLPATTQPSQLGRWEAIRGCEPPPPAPANPLPPTLDPGSPQALERGRGTETVILSGGIGAEGKNQAGACVRVRERKQEIASARVPAGGLQMWRRTRGRQAWEREDKRMEEAGEAAGVGS